MNAELIEPVPDVEGSKLRYSAQFRHVGCGGSPYACGDKLRCMGCDRTWPWVEALGAAIVRTGEFESMVIK